MYRRYKIQSASVCTGVSTQRCTTISPQSRKVSFLETRREGATHLLTFFHYTPGPLLPLRSSSMGIGHAAHVSIAKYKDSRLLSFTNTSLEWYRTSRSWAEENWKKKDLVIFSLFYRERSSRMTTLRTTKERRVSFVAQLFLLA